MDLLGLNGEKKTKLTIILPGGFGQMYLILTEPCNSKFEVGCLKV